MLESGLLNLKNKYPSLVHEIRGRGLILAMAMKESPNPLIENMRNLGLLVVGAAENAIRFLPPLTVSEPELNEALDITEAALKKLYLKST